MAKWVRNWLTPGPTLDSWGTHHHAMMYKELLLAFGWTLNSDDGDPAWTAVGNILVNEPGGGANGFQVSATSPREIYDPLGRFTQAMADDKVSISLFGGALNGGLGDDQNHSLWAITEYIDANHVKVDVDGFNPFGWVTDTQLGGRIFRFDGTRLLNGAWAILDSPPGERAQVRLDYTGTSNLYVRIAPFGKPLVVTGAGTPDAITGTAPTMTVTIAGLIGKLNKHMVGLNITISGAANANDDGTFPVTAVNTTTGAVTYTNAIGVGDANFTGTATIAAIATTLPAGTGENFGDYYTRQFRLNAYADSDGLLLYGLNQDGDFHHCLISKLVDVDPEDSDPWVIWGKHGFTDPYDTGSTVSLWGLNGAVSPAEIRHYFTWLTRNTDINVKLVDIFGRRLDTYGKTPLRSPWIYMADTVTVGAAIRGRVSQLRLGYTSFQNIRPLDASGFWLHWRGGMFVPRNGPQDQLPLYPPAS